MVFDYSKLKGRIVEKFRTRKAFAEAVGMTTTLLASRLNGQAYFRADEIALMCAPEYLDISNEEVVSYFFMQKVE